MFPLYVNFKKEIELVNPEKQTIEKILTYFEKKLSQRKVDNIKIEERSLTFKNSIFRFMRNWNVMLPVDYGEISLFNNNSNKIRIEYTILFRRILLIVGIVSLFIYGNTESIINGLIAFAWLGG